MLKPILEVNGARNEMSLLNFVPGRMIEVPDIKSTTPILLDWEVARYFYHSEHFYPATIKAIELAIAALEQDLRDPQVQRMIREGAPDRGAL